MPPGQYVTEKWPVLHYGSVPRSRPGDVGLQGLGRGRQPVLASLGTSSRRFPRKRVHTDIHCVTRWTRLDTDFEGVPIQHILGLAQLRPSARFVVAHCEQGYTANLPARGARRR